MGRLRQDASHFAGAGVKLLGVVAQKRTRLKAWLDRNPLPFPMLADEERAVSRAYGVYVAINFESFRIARPSTFSWTGPGSCGGFTSARTSSTGPRPDEVNRQLDALRG
jgi:peroxiredoxin